MALPPSAMRAPASIASAASISGRGFERAKMIWPGRTMEREMRPGWPVVVEVCYVDGVLNARLDAEALGRSDILELDDAEGGGDGGYGSNDVVGVLAAQGDRHGVDTDEVCEQGCLALEHWHGRERAEIA